MDKDEMIEGFFIEDEEKFKTEQVLELINDVKKYAKLIGKNGDVHIENKKLSDTDKSKLFLVVRYLGSELAKLNPDLGIDKNISEVTVEEFAKFIDRDTHNARARMSALDKEGFAKKTERGKIRAKSFMIRRFIESLNNQYQSKIKLKTKKQINNQITNKKTKKSINFKKKHLPNFDQEEVYERLSKNLDVPKEKLKDILFFIKDDLFKLDAIPGKSKRSEQINCILTTGYVLLIGFGIKEFKSTFLTKVAFESGIDTSDLKFTVRDIKNMGYITKAGTKTQDNILKDKGKQEAIKIIKEMCS